MKSQAACVFFHVLRFICSSSCAGSMVTLPGHAQNPGFLSSLEYVRSYEVHTYFTLHIPHALCAAGKIATRCDMMLCHSCYFAPYLLFPSLLVVLFDFARQLCLCWSELWLLALWLCSKTGTTGFSQVRPCSTPASILCRFTIQPSVLRTAGERASVFHRSSKMDIHVFYNTKSAVISRVSRVASAYLLTRVRKVKQ
jgi:hypothetical protein